MLRGWTANEILFLKHHYSNTKDSTLSEKLGRSAKSISYMAQKQKLKKGKAFYCEARRHFPFQINKKLLIKLYRMEKKSIRRIAKELKISKGTVSYYLKKHKIKTRNKSEANKERFKWDVCWRKGLTKKTDNRINAVAEKIHSTWIKKKKRKIREIENKFGLTIPELLTSFYWKKNKTQEQIAKELELNRKQIIDLMREFKIVKRPKYAYIASLKGAAHSLYGKSWELIYGKKSAKERKKLASEKFRKLIIERLKNKEMPFVKTKIEESLAKELKKRGINFTQQYCVSKKFVCDFAIPKQKLIVECDGDYWHANPLIYNRKDLETLDKRQKNNLKRDKFKDLFLSRKGWAVMRFFESKIKSDVGACVDEIESFLKNQQTTNPLATKKG